MEAVLCDYLLETLCRKRQG